MASANRLMDVRHSWRSSRRMAEISVPAWPMPIHQTKLRMSKPQPTGWLMPQMPTPTMTSLPMVAVRIMTPKTPAARPTHHSFGIRLRRTMELIWSVTVAKVCPGSTVGTGMKRSGISCVTGRISWAGVWVAMFMKKGECLSLDLGVGVTNRAEVCGARTSIQFSQQCVIRRLGFQRRHAAVRIIHIPEHDRIRRTGLLAGGDDFAIADAAALFFS